MKRKNNAGIFIFYAVVLLGAYLFITSAMGVNIFGASSTRVSYTELVDAISTGKVAGVHIEMGSNATAYVEATLVSDGTSSAKSYLTSYVPASDFVPFVTAYSETAPSTFKVDYKILSEDSWTSILMLLMSIGMLVFVFFFFMNQQSSSSGGKMMNFGKSKARMVNPNEAKINYSDVAGADEEKQELQEIVEFLKNPEKFNRLGARIPKGVLLIGPPGTGKTLLAKATAGEAGVPFFTISGSDFVEMFVGVGASRVRDLFDSAKKNAPCIVFIDEIDAVGRQRGAGLGGGNDEREQTLNQLLVEMDGFTNNQGIIVIAATNRSDILDPALTRPGRFDRQVVVNLPDVRGREEILRVHAKNKKLSDDVDLKIVSKATAGFTGADLENVMNEAALLAARGKSDRIHMSDVTEAIKRVVAGPEKKSRIVTDEDKRITAYHEAGHAVIEHILPNCDSVNEISIIPRGMAAGYTISLPDNDNNHMSRGKLLDEITALLGGRASENVMLDDICTGAVSDIERATEIARKMITAYGMSEKLGPISLGGDSEVFVGKDLMKSKGFSEDLSALIDSETRSIIDRCYERAQLIIENNREKIELVVKYLYAREALSGAMFACLMDEGEEAFLAKFPEEEPKPQSGKSPRSPLIGGLFSSLSPQEKEAAIKQQPDPIAKEALKVEEVVIKSEPKTEPKPKETAEAAPKTPIEPAEAESADANDSEEEKNK